MKLTWGLALAVTIPVVAGAAAGYATKDDVRSKWYTDLQKPPWMPPAAVFGPVWSVLYVLMGVACWRVWKAGGRTQPMVLYGVQLALNVLWSFMFFKAHNLEWALLVVLGLLGAVQATTGTFYAVDKAAGYLMMPYLAWVAFASILTWDIYARNRNKIQA